MTPVITHSFSPDQHDEILAKLDKSMIKPDINLTVEYNSIKV